MKVPNLKAIRLEKLLMQRELSVKSHVSTRVIINAEGGRPIGPLSAHKLANALGVSVEDLMEKEE